MKTMKQGMHDKQGSSLGRWGLMLAGLLLATAASATDWDPICRGGLTGAGEMRAIAVRSNLLCVASGSAGLTLVEASNPAAPVLAGSLDTAGDAWGVAVQGNVVSLADGTNGLVLVDISNPSNPSLLATYNTPGDATEVAVSGNLAVVADGASGLIVLDITDASHPALLGTLDTAGDACGVALSGNRAYVADGTNGLLVLDLSAPSQPRLEGRYPTFGHVWKVVAAGDRAYLADGERGLQIVDLSQPAAPQLLGRATTLGNAQSLALRGDLVAVAEAGQRVELFDVSLPTRPLKVGCHLSQGTGCDVAFLGDYLALAIGTNGLEMVELKEAALQRLNQIAGSPAFGMTSAPEGTVTLTGGLMGLQNGQVYADGSYQVRGGYANGNTNTMICRNVTMAGPIGYVSVDGSMSLDGSKLLIQSYTNPVSPVTIATYVGVGYSNYSKCTARGVTVANGVAYVACGTNGLQVLAVTNPASPVRTAVFGFDKFSLRTYVPVTASALAAGFLYVAHHTNGIRVLTLTNPLVPAWTGTLAVPGSARDIALSGNTAVVACDRAGAAILDLTTPGSPVLVTNVALPGRALSVTMEGTLAYLATDEAGVVVLDVSNRAQPVRLGGNSALTAVDCALTSSVLLVGSGYPGLSILTRPTVGSTVAPAISKQPADVTVSIGRPAALAITATGSAPLGYQWYKEGVTLAGASSSTLALSAVALADMGGYAVVITNAVGSVTSRVAVLMVTVPPTLGGALNAWQLPWRQGWNGVPWCGDVGLSYDGSHAAAITGLADGQESWLETEVTGPGELSFWWRSSTQTNADYLELYLNGVRQGERLSGETEWRQVVKNLPLGSQVVRWRFAKDLSSAAGADGAWLDQVQWKPALYQHKPVLHSGGVQYLLQGDYNSRYRVEWSTNLWQWDLLTNVTCQGHAVPVADAQSPGGRRFYRVLSEP